MSQAAIAERYATALFELAVDQQKIDPVNDELRAIARIVREYPDLAKLLAHPLVSAADKQETLLKLAAGASDLLRNFLRLVVDKGRQTALPAIADSYRALVDAHYKRVVAQVTTAVPMDEETQHLLKKQLSDYLAQDVQILAHEDPAILGGVVVRVGDRLIDGSVRGRLQALAQSLN